MSDMARYNPEEGTLQVRFASGGRGGMPNTYEYTEVTAGAWRAFLRGDLADRGTATHYWLKGRGGVRV
jgi:hypothetical protein